MAARLLALCRAFAIFFVFSTTLAQDKKKFPDNFVSSYYTTEVQISYPGQLTASYAKEYYDSLEKRGALKLYFRETEQSIYYDAGAANEIIVLDSENCTVTFPDASPFGIGPINYGWLNKNPLIIGPSALLWYGVANKDKAVYKGIETARGIECDKFELNITTDKDNLNLAYYFAPKDWTTPYSYNNLAVPVRVHVTGKSADYSAGSIKTQVNEINDYAYFRPDLGDSNNLYPPTGIGCENKNNTDEMPSVPKYFQYSAEVVDLLQVAKHEDVEVQFQRTWFDSVNLMARRDKYSKKTGFVQNLYDFKTGSMYSTSYPGSCKIQSLKDTEFFQMNGMTGLMMTPEKALNLDGSFYTMGKANIRGIPCEVFESVKPDSHYEGKLYSRLVVTVYFTKSNINVAVKSETESRIPVFYTITGYDENRKKTLQLQYNIYEFTDVVAPPMYSTYRLDRCYEKPESKAYFIAIMDIGAIDAAKMEEQDPLIMMELRTRLAQHAKIPEMRIPYLKADYKSSGVFVTGIMVERPPEMIQFYKGFTGDTYSHDPFLKTKDAATLEECAKACVDENGDPCKGFYMCNQVCFVTFNDPSEKGNEKNRTVLGECTEYIRTMLDSTNFRQAYLIDALGNLENAILDSSIKVFFVIPNGEEIVTVTDIIIGDGPYTGVDAGDKPYGLNVEWRKLNKKDETTRVVDYANSLHDCYKRCKEAGSLCSSFSYCPDSPKDNKECLISSSLVVKGVTKDTELLADKFCNVYNLRFSDYFVPYPEKVSLLPGDKSIRSVSSLEECAEKCRRETDFTCRGFEYCRTERQCTLHKEHILQLKAGETGAPIEETCIHYAARYIADYMDLGKTLVDDSGNVRTDLSLEECAQYCSEDLKENCKSFNYCLDDNSGRGSCAVSKKLLRDDGVPTTVKKGCNHYEKRDEVHDWDNNKKAVQELSKSGYTKKGFAGLVVGMIALGLVVGAGAFVLYSYIRSRNSGEGMAIRFMKNES